MTDDDLAMVELRAMRSAWTALRVRWDLTAREVRALLPAGGEDAERPPRDTETRMRIMVEVGYRVGVPCDLLHDWLRTASPVLGWLSPLDAMAGTLADLRGFRRVVELGFAS